MYKEYWKSWIYVCSVVAKLQKYILYCLSLSERLYKKQLKKYVCPDVCNVECCVYVFINRIGKEIKVQGGSACNHEFYIISFKCQQFRKVKILLRKVTRCVTHR